MIQRVGDPMKGIGDVGGRDGEYPIRFMLSNRWRRWLAFQAAFRRTACLGVS